jgi:hypothetical protein
LPVTVAVVVAVGEREIMIAHANPVMHDHLIGRLKETMRDFARVYSSMQNIPLQIP